jgi:Ca2+/H+ antiporter, TMEM165/GDT1 family
VEPGVVLTVFGLVAVAELPDKTMIATLIMGSRYRPVLVWLGATLAFGIHVTLAVLVGGLLALLPHPWIEGVTALLFGAGAAYLLLMPEKEVERQGEEEGEDEEGEEESGRAAGGLRTVGTAFAVIFVGEFGDLTQILTANLVAKYHAPVSVFVGAFAALACVSALGAFAGRALLRYLPLAVIRKVGGVLLLGFAAYSLAQLI